MTPRTGRIGALIGGAALVGVIIRRGTACDGDAFKVILDEAPGR